MRKIILAVAMCLGGAAMASDETHGSGIMVHDVKAAASVGMAKAGAGYMVIMNHSTHEDRLLEVRADLPRVEIHNIVEVDGQTRMVRQDDGILVPAGESVMLAPGGFHVMFMGLSAPFVAGETVDAVLVFEKAGEVPVTFEIVDRAMLMKEGGMDHGTMDHSGQDGHDG